MSTKKRLAGMVTAAEISAVVSELEDIAPEPSDTSVAAIYVLKNELGQLDSDTPSRRLEYDRQFHVPGGWLYQLRRWYRKKKSSGPLTWLRDLVAHVGGWWRGTDTMRFRDRCDHYFYEEIVPEISEHFGEIAGAMMNTVNEAVINYAEYSFKKRALGRRLRVHLFKTEGDMGYAIVRPLGWGLRAFDPLNLRTKKARTLREARRGWGHTIMMERALFISFDHEPRSRGMMIIVGPEDPRRVPAHTD